MRKIEELIEILCGFISDIQSSIELIKDLEYHQLYGDNTIYRQGAYRVCLNAIFLNMAKFIEFHEKYNETLHELVPYFSEERKRWVVEFNKRQVRDFRNKFVAHIRCKKSKKPLTYEEMDCFVEKICGGKDPLVFFEWISPRNTTNGFISHVTSTKEYLRNMI